ncbi:MAG TPA: hypothetical protein VE034_05195 [Burkholderiales bacterium]|nr:hypothetical protein [Burkholderiales bacterium]
MRKIALVPVVALAFLTASCQKVPEYAPLGANLKQSTASLTDSVPAAYGQLVSVTPSTTPYVSIMWFRKADGSIVAVGINYSRGALGQSIVEIPRK